MKLIQEAEEQKIYPSQLCGILLHKFNYIKKRDIAKVGYSVFQGTFGLITDKFDLDDGVYVLSHSELGRNRYTQLSRHLAPYLKKKMHRHTELTPAIHDLSDIDYKNKSPPLIWQSPRGSA